MNILVATHTLSNVGGAENYTYAIIEELVKRKLNVEYFSFKKGMVSDLIEKELGVPFFSKKKKYDLILASHHTTVSVLWKYGFIIQTCHGIFPPLERPSFFADAYVAVSQEVQKHLALKGHSSVIINNGVNCDRFKPKKPLNLRLKSVASLCHSREANELVKQACADLGVDFVSLNKFEGGLWNVEDAVNEVDLVVGLGRSVYDAMACGRTIVVFDKRDYAHNYGDGYLRPVLGLSLQNNCSGRFLKKEFSIEALVKELNRYDPADGEFFRDFAVNNLNISAKVDEYFSYFNSISSLRKRDNFLLGLQKVFLINGKAFIYPLQEIRKLFFRGRKRFFKF